MPITISEITELRRAKERICEPLDRAFVDRKVAEAGFHHGVAAFIMGNDPDGEVGPEKVEDGQKVTLAAMGITDRELEQAIRAAGWIRQGEGPAVMCLMQDLAQKACITGNLSTGWRIGLARASVVRI